MRDPQSIQGPADGRLKHSEVHGYQSVSRIGEVVVAAVVDMYQHAALPDMITAHDVDPTHVPANDGTVYEHRPHAFEWGSALPGQIAVARRARNTAARHVSSIETAQPVIVSCACLGEADMAKFYFAGIVRSKAVQKIDDGCGPSEDEMFTLTINAQATVCAIARPNPEHCRLLTLPAHHPNQILNNSNETIYAGDMIEVRVKRLGTGRPSTPHLDPNPKQWTFFNSLNPDSKSGPKSALDLVNGGLKRGNTYPRKIAVKVASVDSDRLIGRALSHARPLEQFDLVRAHLNSSSLSYRSPNQDPLTLHSSSARAEAGGRPVRVRVYCRIVGVHETRLGRCLLRTETYAQHLGCMPTRSVAGRGRLGLERHGCLLVLRKRAVA